MARLGRSYAARPFISPPTTRTRVAVATALLGTLAASATGVRTAPASASAPLGALAGSAGGVRTAQAAASAPLGTLVGAATVAPQRTATASAPLGAVVGTATAFRTRLGTASAPLGPLVGTAAGHRVAAGTATATLGALAGSATGVRTRPATATAPLGALVGTAAALRTAVSTATAALGALTATATGTATRPPSSATFTFGQVDVEAATAPRSVSGTARFVLGAVGFEADGTTPIPGFTVTGSGGQPTLALYDVDGRTKISNLHPGGGKWQNVLNEAGTLSFRLPMDDATTLQAKGKRWVKAFWKGRARIASRLDVSTTNHAVDGRVWRQFDLQGALAVTGRAIVWPENGFQPTTGTTRTFSYMSKRDFWYINDDWTGAVCQPLATDTGYRKRKPLELRGFGASWIAKTDPYSTSTTRQWFRREFTTYTEFDWELLLAGDGLMEVWIDGEQVFSPEQANGQAFRFVAQLKGTFAPGNHRIAVQVSKLGSGAIALAGALRRLKANGDPMKGAPFMVTDRHWRVADVFAGHSWGEMLALLWEEATLRNVRPVIVLTRQWTDYHDCNGLSWTDHGPQTVDIGRSYLEVIQQFSEAGFDVDVNFDAMTVRIYQRKGKDRSASTPHFTVADNVAGTGSLKEHSVTRSEPGVNSALMQLADGSWTLREDAASVTSYGREEIGLSVGTTPATSTADRVADSQFNETAHPTRSFKSQTSSLTGPQPYTHYDVGDEKTVPDEDNTGTLKARIVAITVEFDNEAKTVNAFPDFEEDRT